MKVAQPTTRAERIVRCFHLAISAVLIFAMLYFLCIVRLANSYAIFIFGAASIVPLCIGMFAKRKLVFQMLLLGYLFEILFFTGEVLIFPI
ncbi:hypothetical protein D0T25_23350 [Duganella sp. BJB488]|uniref:hypothetical protein n=1 Tax=unclassified Duganella TaxID=2636909 RepID=UPI000E349298|nr:MULTISPECIES: hypothetical protein [unclassified Duganella]RFP13199.1 hypothetical protein D0T26_23205 [Duganella sp. BJB489]RFP31554.1 hypothetical protein D0T24_24300 [Duganella sp. BJB480]RFP09311.1 hypothetical protein D0T23_26770 [Duganella sp. BJB475]RFP17041.1 hypothetical protein D0T25_23350 [Duganella sp. BJB488]RFP25347.1 hypothetical protein D0T21_27800 [Duganella sp. BJB476]